MSIDRLLAIMSRLRDPQTGCPWDREQSFASIAPYTIEEAYEVADAIERGDLKDLESELGDLLFQVVFHAQLAREQGAFEFDAVVNAICDKLERRHPHVFGDARIATAEEQNVAWEEHKRKERAARNGEASATARDGGSAGRRMLQATPAFPASMQVRNAGAVFSALDGIPIGLPALTRAAKLGKRASSVGFDWPNIDGVLDKIEEEIHELRAALKSQSQDEVQAELGDVLFSISNLGRHLHVDLETALRHTNAKFERRFRYVETELRKQGKTPQQATLEEMDKLWEEAKALEGRGARGVGPG